jgi:hypothetical protein
LFASRRYPHLLHALGLAVVALVAALVVQAAVVPAIGALASFALLGVVLGLAVLWPLR